MSVRVKRKCQVQGCKGAAEHWCIELDAPNTTALNGQLCKYHYNRLLQVIHEVLSVHWGNWRLYGEK
jgi:hypothetical protein